MRLTKTFCPFVQTLKMVFHIEDGFLLDFCSLIYLFQFSSVAQSCPTLCNPMNHRTPGLPVHHQLPESTQTHVDRVSDAIQPSHPLLSPSPPALNLSKHQGFSSESARCISIGVSSGQSIGFAASTSVLPMNFQD